MRYARFYRLMTRSPQEGQCLTWHRRRKDADQALEDYKRDNDCEGSSIRPVKIHLSTEGIICWLNIFFATDNG